MPFSCRVMILCGKCLQHPPGAAVVVSVILLANLVVKD
ncbi:MAG: hypothetical protein OJF51_000314 [Nitrospira sp.]|nr:MAG: hypothetical protein OJF51_000314 [Nitrospira sp.]